MKRPLLSLCTAALMAACYSPPSAEVDAGDRLGQSSEEINLNNCPAKITCPEPVNCDRAWDDKPRDPAWPACAPPPDGCKQVVFGRFDDMKKYLGCPGYITLNLKDWTQKKNDEFTACAAADQLGATCKPPILIASADGNIPDTGTVLSIELCQLHACKCKVTTNAGGTGSVKDCPKKKAKEGTKKKNTTCAASVDFFGLMHQLEATGTPGPTPTPTPTGTPCEDHWTCEACDPETDADCAEDVEMCGCVQCGEDDDDPRCSEDLDCPGAEPTPTPTPTGTPW